MDCRRLDRRHQRRADRGQCAEPAPRTTARILGSGVIRALAAPARLARGPRHPESVERRAGVDVRHRRLLHASRVACVHDGRRRADPELLRHRPTEADARALDRFRPHQCARDSPQRRRSERAHRQLGLLRQRRAAHRPRAHHGQWRPATGIPARGSRRRIVLGRRHRLEHAAAVRARQPSVQRVPGGRAGGSLQFARRNARHSVGRPHATEGLHLLESHAHEYRRTGCQREPPAGDRRPDGQAATGLAQRRKRAGGARAAHARADRRLSPDLPQQALRGRLEGLRVLARDVLDHWEAGLRDMHTTLSHPAALERAAQSNGITTFDLGEGEAIRIKRPLIQESAP